MSTNPEVRKAEKALADVVIATLMLALVSK